MNKTDILHIFRSTADVYFNEHGFKYYKKREAYRKVDERYTFLCHFRIVDAEAPLIEPSFSIRSPEVEDVFHAAIGTQERFCDMTSVLWPSAGVLLHGDSADINYPATTEEEVVVAANQFLAVFETEGQEFFSQCANMSTIQDILNRTPENLCLYQPSVLHRCCFGMIAAYILDLAAIEQLRLIYERKLNNFSGGFYLPQYRSLVERLGQNRSK